jgi:hypothetical protein
MAMPQTNNIRGTFRIENSRFSVKIITAFFVCPELEKTKIYHLWPRSRDTVPLVVHFNILIVLFYQIICLLKMSICPANIGIIQFKLYVSVIRMKEAAEVGFLRMKIAAFTELYLPNVECTVRKANFIF